MIIVTEYQFIQLIDLILITLAEPEEHELLKFLLSDTIVASLWVAVFAVSPIEDRDVVCARAEVCLESLLANAPAIDGSTQVYPHDVCQCVLVILFCAE